MNIKKEILDTLKIVNEVTDETYLILTDGLKLVHGITGEFLTTGAKTTLSYLEGVLVGFKIGIE